MTIIFNSPANVCVCVGCSNKTCLERNSKHAPGTQITHAAVLLAVSTIELPPASAVMGVPRYTMPGCKTSIKECCKLLRRQGQLRPVEPPNVRAHAAATAAGVSPSHLHEKHSTANPVLRSGRSLSSRDGRSGGGPMGAPCECRTAFPVPMANPETLTAQHLASRRLVHCCRTSVAVTYLQAL